MVMTHTRIKRKTSLQSESQGPERERAGGGGREGEKAGEKTAGLEPIRPGEAPSTCTARPPGESPSDKMRDHHHYHYLFAKQRPTLGPILIGFTNYNEHLVLGCR